MDDKLVPIDDVVTLDTLPRGGGETAMLLRMSVETAKKYPRDIKTVVETLIATLNAFPEYAEKAIYSIPYEDKKKGRIVKVEGMSIRAAESIISEWGNTMIEVRVVGEDENGWDIMARAIDWQKMNAQSTMARASKYAKVGGQFVLLDLDRQRMALNSAASKLKRNVILALIPMQVKAAYDRRVREIMAGGVEAKTGDLLKLADVKRVAACVSAFASDFAVTQAQLETYVKKPLAEWTGADLADLKALYLALEDGETTVAVAFPAAAATETPAADPLATATVTKVETEVLSSAVKDAPPAPAPPAAVVPAPETRQESREVKVQAPAVETITPAAPAPATKPKATRAAAAQGAAPVTPAASPAAEAMPAEYAQQIEQFTKDLAACATKADLTVLQGQLYSPGGPVNKLPRPMRAVLVAKVNARRAELDKAEQQP